MDRRIRKISNRQFDQITSSDFLDQNSRVNNQLFIYWCSYSGICEKCFKYYDNKLKKNNILISNYKNMNANQFLYKSLSAKAHLNDLQKRSESKYTRNLGLKIGEVGREMAKSIEHAFYLNPNDGLISVEYYYLRFNNSLENKEKDALRNKVIGIAKVNKNEYVFRRCGLVFLNSYKVSPDYNAAYVYFRNALEIDSEFSSCYMHLVDTCMFLGKKKEAKYWLDKYVAGVPMWAIDQKFVEELKKLL
jgi:hypothetical protein